jgi:hypothetical protein
MLTPELFWKVFKVTGSVAAYLLYKKLYYLEESLEHNLKEVVNA